MTERLQVIDETEIKRKVAQMNKGEDEGSIKIPSNNPPLKETTEKVETPAQTMMKGASSTEILHFPAKLTETEQTISLIISPSAEREKVLKAAVETPTRISIDPSTAIEVSTNTVYQIGGFTANTQLLVKLPTQGMPKLSSVIQFDAAVVVETIVFTLDANNNSTVIADSVNVLNDFDIVSFLPNGGVYYVLYIAYAGGGNAAIYLPSSASASSNEPNDSPYQVPLRNAECYFNDTFDNSYDADVIRVKITKPEPVSISLTFGDVEVNGKVTLRVYHKEDENGTAVNKWIINSVLTVPTVGTTWNNTAIKGECYIYVQYNSGSILNRPYSLSFTPLSKLQRPEWITTGKDTGMTGIEYGTVNEASGGYLHWVSGSFKVITDFSQTSSHLVRTETGDYPLIPFCIRLVGQDKNGDFDYKNNTNYSNSLQNDKYGYATVSVLLPGPWGNDSSLPGSYFQYPYDINMVQFYFLAYDNNEFALTLVSQQECYATFYYFLNVDM